MKLIVRAAARRRLDAFRISIAFGSSAGGAGGLRPARRLGGLRRRRCRRAAAAGRSRSPPGTRRARAAARGQTLASHHRRLPGRPDHGPRAPDSWNHAALEHLVGDRRRDLVDEHGPHLGVVAQHLDDLLHVLRLRLAPLLPRAARRSIARTSARPSPPSGPGSGTGRRPRRRTAAQAPRRTRARVESWRPPRSGVSCCGCSRSSAPARSAAWRAPSPPHRRRG